MFHIPAHKQPPVQPAPVRTLADYIRDDAREAERLAAQRWLAARRAGRLNHRQGA